MKLTPEEEIHINTKRLKELAKEIPGVQVLTDVKCGQSKPQVDTYLPDHRHDSQVSFTKCTNLYRHKGKHSWES